MSEQPAANVERRARIFNVQKYSIYDGPGIRTLVFFKGCPLRCRWCSNPESLEKKYQVMYKKDMCVHCGACIPVCPAGIHFFQEENAEEGPRHSVNRRVDCIGCRACEGICPRKALSIAGEDRTVSEVLQQVLQDTAFYNTSGGGVTLGGGEVTMQPEFAANLLMECKRAGVHTAIETCGHTKLANLLALAQHTDLFLYDLKHINPDRHQALTGVRNERILENLEELIRRRYTVLVRMPLMKGLNDDEETIAGAIKLLAAYKDLPNFKGIDLLPYHKLGINKYGQLDMPYTLEEDLSLSDDDLLRIERQIRQYDFPVRVVKH